MDIFGVTDIGCVRKRNEDAIHWQALPGEGRYLAVLADGMGGYGGGALASKLAVEYFTKCVLSSLEFLTEYSNENMLRILSDAGSLANNAVRQERANHPDYQKMGTTLIAMLVMDEEYWLMHAGDSRCYCASGDGLQPMTRDRSIENSDINVKIVDVLEGTRPAFDKRDAKYWPVV